eukprot:9478190-Pyramimonas_sp.AAC.2
MTHTRVQLSWSSGLASARAHTRTCDARKESVGELNSRVTRLLDKVLMVKSTGPVSSPSLRSGATLH